MRGKGLSYGCDVMGYPYWGAIDVVSVGTARCASAVYVDRFNDGHVTLERVKKESYDWYRRVIETNEDYSASPLSQEGHPSPIPQARALLICQTRS